MNLMWYNITGRSFNCLMAVEVLGVLRHTSKVTLKVHAVIIAKGKAVLKWVLTLVISAVLS